MRQFGQSLLMAVILTASVVVGQLGRLSAAEMDHISGPDLQMAPMSPAQPADPAALMEMPLAEISSPTGLPENNRMDVSRNRFSESSSVPAFGESYPRSEQLENIARQADRHTRHGYELAGRGAFFAARSEFMASLRLLAEGLDTEQRTHCHSHALSVGMMAIKEAEDFLPRDSSMDADLDLPRIIQSHVTPVLKESQDGLTPMVALKCYLTFAQEQLASAVGCEVAGSMALHGLGKLHASVSRNKTVRIMAAEPKAVVFYQASLLVDSKNFMAANDLGVLFAQCGNYSDAKRMLEHSLAVRAQSASWQNLAVVCRQLGEAGLASQAMQQASVTRQAELTRRRGMQLPVQDNVQWMDANSFAQTSTITPSSPDAVQGTTNGVAAQSATRSSMSQSGQTPSGTSSTGTSPTGTSPTVGWSIWGSQNSRK